MKYSGNDTLTKIVAEAMPSLMPASEMRRWKRIDHAIDDSGYVNVEAVQLLGALYVAFLIDDTTYNSATTADFTTCCEANIELGNGTWTLNVQAQSRGGHSAGTSIDYRLRIDGLGYTTVTKSAPTTHAAPITTNEIVSGLDGGRSVNILAEFKCDTGATATVSNTTLQIIGIRTA
jgi:hypothetical protein